MLKTPNFFISNFMSENEVFRDFLENTSEFLAEISYLDSSQRYLQLSIGH